MWYHTLSPLQLPADHHIDLTLHFNETFLAVRCGNNQLRQMEGAEPVSAGWTQPCLSLFHFIGSQSPA